MELTHKLRFINQHVPPHTYGRLAVIDIGSSSIRLVVYEDVRNYPYMILNQKVWCALGKGKGDGDFYIEEDRMERACTAIEWFIWVAKETGATSLFAVATSAVREAENGQQFVDSLRERLGLEVSIIDGEAEAKLSAKGACASIPDADGLVVDLGGGSLELYDTRQKRFESLPLGVLSLREISKDNPKKAADILYKEIMQVPWINEIGPSIVAIGSGMRAIARLHMAEYKYPLKILHDYHLRKDTGTNFCKRIITGEVSKRTSDMTKAYKDVMPYRAAALHALLRLKPVEEVRFATFGLREGVLFSQVGSCPVLEDPLLAFAADLAERDGKGLLHAENLASWVHNILPEMDMRFLRAAAMMAEIAWREQPLYRARTAFERVLGGSYVAADHAMRVQLALAVYFRHEDRYLPGMTREIKGILTAEQTAAARKVGALFALAAVLDPGAKGILDRFNLECGSDGAYHLNGPEAFIKMGAEEVEKRFVRVQKLIKC